MGTGRKQQLHRKTAQAYSHNEDSLAAIAWLHEQFEEVHPEHAAMLNIIAQNILITQEFIKQFAIKTWGHFPADPATWLQ